MGASNRIGMSNRMDAGRLIGATASLRYVCIFHLSFSASAETRDWVIYTQEVCARASTSHAIISDGLVFVVCIISRRLTRAALHACACAKIMGQSSNFGSNCGSFNLPRFSQMIQKDSFQTSYKFNKYNLAWKDTIIWGSNLGFNFSLSFNWHSISANIDEFE